MDEIQANDSPFKHQEQKNPKIRLIDELIEKQCNKGSIAIYGAGIHTEELLFHTKLRDLIIEYIVDKNPGNDDVFGLPILKPVAIENNPPDIVLISSFKYQNEIADYLVGALSYKGKIVKLYSKEDTSPFYLQYN